MVIIMNVIYKDESYQIIGICMDIHNYFGHGFSEIVYKDALELEFRKVGMFYDVKKNMKLFIKE